jgi:hypothetical protein
MRSHERLNRRSASVSGESRQVTESGVTEPGLQADSPLHIAPTCDAVSHTGRAGHMCLRSAEGVVERVSAWPSWALSAAADPAADTRSHRGGRLVRGAPIVQAFIAGPGR